MGFLSGLFKKKAGGSLVGNLVRGVVGASPLGQLGLGSGAGIMTQEQIDMKDLSDEQFLAKYGKTKAGVVPYTPQPVNPASLDNTNSNSNSNMENFSLQKVKDWFKTDMGKIVAVILSLGTVFLIWKKVKGSKSKKGIF